jgi:hypothetical protein
MLVLKKTVEFEKGKCRIIELLDNIPYGLFGIG